VDYIDAGGTPTNRPAGAAYMREWLISDSTPTIKTITVNVQQITSSRNVIPATTVLVCRKSSGN
jgi:hypothetical protein